MRYILLAEGGGFPRIAVVSANWTVGNLRFLTYGSGSAALPMLDLVIGKRGIAVVRGDQPGRLTVLISLSPW